MLSKGMQVMKMTTQLGPSDQAIVCGRGIRSPCNRMATEKRRWKWMVQKAKPYLSKANAYGGSNSDEEGNLPSLPVPSFPLPRPPASSAASVQAQRDGKKDLPPCGSSARSGAAFRNCLFEILFKNHFEPLQYCQ